jgi:hypothetical protein
MSCETWHREQGYRPLLGGIGIQSAGRFGPKPLFPMTPQPTPCPFIRAPPPLVSPAVSVGTCLDTRATDTCMPFGAHHQRHKYVLPVYEGPGPHLPSPAPPCSGYCRYLVASLWARSLGDAMMGAGRYI